MKVGQYPPYSIETDSLVDAKLGDKADWFQKGLICESQSYGIGAFAYYRRIVEEVIDDLLKEIGELVSGDEQEEYRVALNQVRDSHVAADKIDLVKHLLPSVLRRGGVNPLNLLHGALSEGIHALSDEECLERAIMVRDMLVFLVHQVRETERSAKRFREQAQKLLEKRAERD